MFNDAFHPVDGKASLIYLKRHGELKLRFQQNDSSWQEVSAQLGPLLSTKEPFTHAAFASNNDNSLFLAAYDVALRLHLYRIEISWNIPPEKRNANAGPFEKPGLHASLISTEFNCNPVAFVVGDLSNGSEPKAMAAAQLTHLDFMPVTPEEGDGSLPTIQAVFCRPPNICLFDPVGSPSQTAKSVAPKPRSSHIEKEECGFNFRKEHLQIAAPTRLRPPLGHTSFTSLVV
jgi:mediator of RNA polymerase II transcription subunit 16